MSYVSRARSTDQRYYGVAEGIVVDNEDPEGEGRVTLRFPWFDNEMVSDWCRVANGYAGNGYGTAFVPEVGDEVLVAFVHGDMRMPVVLGGLYNGEDKPATERSADVDQKLIRTKHGHQLLFDDSDGDERVRLETSGGHSADLSDVDGTVTVASSGGHSVTLDDNGPVASVVTSGGHRVELDDSGTITISHSGGTSITLDAASVTVSGSQISLDGSQIKLGGSGASQGLVLGDAFMSLFNAHVHNATSIGAPTSPPLTPMTPVMISQVSKTA